MGKLICITFLCAIKSFTSADYYQNNFTISNLPGGMLAEIMDIATMGVVDTFEGCEYQKVDVESYVKFWYNHRGHPNGAILLDPNNPDDIEEGKPVKILIHGWLCNVTNDGMPQLKNAYLKRYDSNVIRVDWSRYSIDLYSSSFCYAPEVASGIHVVGHSMGAQIAGLAGQEVKQLCNSAVGRITGLDPAGPLYQLVPESRRLDASDAEFVDVIHTNQNFFGFHGPCGDADFFPNGGTYQPGCFDHSYTEGMVNFPLSIIKCNHLRSLEYMIESINPGKNEFVGESCSIFPGLPLVGRCIPDLVNSSIAVMGEGCPSNLHARNFYLTTISEYPFARSEIER